MLTEIQIESMVERRFDALDSLLMQCRVNQDEYNLRARAIAEWAECELQARSCYRH
jgi:hypothetical protein